MRSWSALLRKQLPTTKVSISVPIKQEKASSGVQTIARHLFPARQGNSGLGNDRACHTLQTLSGKSCVQKKPLSSSRRSSSVMNAPLSLVLVKIT
jgi:hypothetical protein